MKVFSLIAEVRQRYSLCANRSYIALAMAGEAGELANLAKKQWGGYQEIPDEDLKRELADVMNYLLHQMMNLGMTFEDLDDVCCEKARAFIGKLNAYEQKDRGPAPRTGL